MSGKRSEGMPGGVQESATIRGESARDANRDTMGVIGGDVAETSFDAARVREALEAGLAGLDDTARARLAAARRAAVAAATPTSRWRTFAWPAAALAASLALWIGLREPAPALPPPATDVADYAQGLVVATEDDAAALAEDLEFYAWLETQSQGG